ncbi:hypothetical protein Dda_1440 [Drechslerella dactyloides]|uniref:Cyclin-D1-binding protein 1-like N-terminal domain-containing protein n=1 Tax=Drechslerella dactyloides TaxID=74499 RepID=A0AAD6NN35_DREDA|nr:hypothetical protein Dda_1440 [Drechslerella dactyloides]
MASKPSTDAIAPPLPAVITSTLSSIATTLQLVSAPPAADPAVAAASSTYAAIPLYTFLADFANLAKAHATKLGLLTNPPIEASSHPAIARILVDVTNSILPVASSVPYIASRERYGTITHDAVVKGVIDTLKAIEEMVLAIESNLSNEAGAQEKEEQKLSKSIQRLQITDLRQATSASSATKSSYTSTGQIWSSADALLTISQKHLIGLVESKLRSHADMLNDCIAEFKEWVTDAAEELRGEDSGFEDEGSQSSSSVHADPAFDDDDDDEFWGSTGGTNKTKVTKEILATAEATQKKLKLTSILYTAVMKRRVKDPSTRLGGVFLSTKVPVDGDEGGGKEYSVEKERNADRLERIVQTSNALVGKTDDLAAAFYDGEEIGVVQSLRSEVVQLAAELAGAARLDGDGGEDAPSAWFGKFLENIRT